jgi:hypothetical protein
VTHNVDIDDLKYRTLPPSFLGNLKEFLGGSLEDFNGMLPPFYTRDGYPYFLVCPTCKGDLRFRKECALSTEAIDPDNFAIHVHGLTGTGPNRCSGPECVLLEKVKEIRIVSDSEIALIVVAGWNLHQGMEEDNPIHQASAFLLQWIKESWKTNLRSAFDEQPVVTEGSEIDDSK